MTYSTKLSLKNKKKKKKRPNKHKRNYVFSKWKKKAKKIQTSKKNKHKLLRLFYTASFVSISITTIAIIIFLSYLQSITKDLPSPDQPFGKKNIASEMYDRNGNLIYKVFGDENRDLVKLEDLPPELIWAFLAAEDINFYEHPGIDVKAMTRCGLKALSANEIVCGGSTITQQLIKQTALSNEQSIERKVKEALLALRIETLRSKDEILEMYLTVIPEGSNIYSVNSGAQFYFGKKTKKLSLAEMAILASIPQNPTFLSPTKSANPELAQQLLKERQLYVLDQMELHMDRINKAIQERTGKDKLYITKERLEKARNQKLKYKKPNFKIEAPHFVFYAQKLLQERGIYNNGRPFTLAELETGGYKIWTTLDLEYQKIAEDQVRKGVKEYGGRYGADNGAMVVIDPKNGHILSLVGSKNYFGTATPKGCKLGESCTFEPNVNITNTLQSYGSSMKPMAFYMAIMDGIISPGSQLPDVPIKLGKYEPKNWDGKFSGVNTARWMLVNSRNIPAIYLVDYIGVNNFIKEMKKWGYTTLNNPNGYGLSIVVGGGDVKLIEHAQAYTVFANDGKLTRHEVILKIEDRDGNLIYKNKPRTKTVADPKGIYLINHILNGKNGGPGMSWDGRDIAGKTGTSENQKETLFATYTPEIVVVGWMGNNNNKGMIYGATGQTSVRPWVGEFVQRIGNKIPATPFNRPPGIISYGGDLAIANKSVSPFITTQSLYVCEDQQDRLARPEDFAAGKAIKKTFVYYKLPNTITSSWSGISAPKYYCTIPR